MLRLQVQMLRLRPDAPFPSQIKAAREAAHIRVLFAPMNKTATSAKPAPFLPGCPGEVGQLQSFPDAANSCKP